MRSHRPVTSLLVTLGTAAAVGLQAAPAAAAPGGGGPAPGPRACTASDEVQVPGAEHAQTACLPDITTAGLLTAPAGTYTDQPDWLSLHAPGTTNPSGPWQYGYTTGLGGAFTLLTTTGSNGPLQYWGGTPGVYW